MYDGEEWNGCGYTLRLTSTLRDAVSTVDAQTPVTLWLAITCGLALTAKMPREGYPDGLRALLVVMLLAELVRESAPSPTKFR